MVAVAEVVGGDSGSESKTSSNYIIYTAETNSIDNAINIIDSYVNKNINLSHCKVLVISEAVAKSGLQDIVNSMINRVEVRPDCNIIISQIPPGEFDDESTPELSDVLATYYDVTSNIENRLGYSESVKLNDFYLDLNNTFSHPYATLGLISNTSSNKKSNDTNSSLDSQARSLVSTPSESSVESLGVAAFKNDTLVGTLSANQTLAHQLIQNKLFSSTINMPSPFNNAETLDVYISTLRNPKINVTINNGSPFVELKLYITARLLSFNSNTISTITDEKINVLKSYVSKYMQNQIYDYLDTTSKKMNTDIAGIGKHAAKNFKTIQEWENYNWLENYKNATFNVNVSVLVKSGHLLSNE